MPVTPFIPLIASGIGMITGRPKGPGAQEKSALAEQTAAARQTRMQGQQMFQFGAPLLQRSSNYYDTLLRGNRSATQAMLAPEVANLNDVYKGAGKSLERSGLRGPTKDMAEAELSRQKAGQIGGMVLNARPGAASAVTAIGQGAIGAGMGGTQASGGLYNSLVQGMRDDRAVASQQSYEYGQSVGGFITDLLRAIPWNKNAPSQADIFGRGTSF